MRPFAAQQALLVTIPGVDALTAAAIIAEIGIDMAAFGTARRLAAWAGLCPANHERAETWRLEAGDQLRGGVTALLPGVRPERDRATIGLGARSAVGRFLRSRRTWDLEHDLPAELADEIVLGIVDRLRGHLLVGRTAAGGELRGVRIAVAAMRWTRGDGGRRHPTGCGRAPCTCAASTCGR